MKPKEDLTCPRCNRTWGYGGLAFSDDELVTCPSCGLRVKLGRCRGKTLVVTKKWVRC